MRVASLYVGPIANSHKVRVIGVQFVSPFHTKELVFAPRTGVAAWDAVQDAAHRRIQRTQSVLSTLLKLEASRDTPSIIAFPEYSVPRLAHTEIEFQSLADESNCIIIPGSYFEDSRESPRFKQNVCKIYTPHKPQIIIAKLHPTPGESKFVKPAFEDANSAHLSWRCENGSNVSVNVFLCRDYLMGRRDFLREPPSALGAGTTTSVATEPDFADEGMNLVLMHSDETRLFEGVGGLDLRGLRGQRRLALLVNAGHTGSPLGSALLGAAGVRERDDVICSVPADSEGVITADVRLRDIKETTLRPGRDIDGPITSVTAWELLEEDGVARIRQAKANFQAPRHRAVWRPAFLEAIDMSITIEFYAAHKISKVIDLFECNQVDSVYAGLVRGVHDISVRRYVHKSASHTSFIDDCTPRTQHALRESLHVKEGMRLTLSPRDILKYRGQRTDEDDYADLLAAVQDKLHYGEAHEDLSERKQLMSDILSLAETCEQDTAIPEHLKAFFYDALEEVIPTGDESDLRETYVFVMRTPGGGTDNDAINLFEQVVIKGQLMQLAIVREIFRISQRLNPPFQYLLKLKCTSREADKLVHQMRLWGDRHELAISTRTIDIHHYLSQASLSGVNATNLGESAIKFVHKFRNRFSHEEIALVPQVQKRAEHGHWILLKIAACWDRTHRIATRRIPTKVSDNLFAFYANLLLHFAEGGNVDLRHFDALRVAWRSCFDALEKAFGDGLTMIHAAGALGDPETDKLTLVRAYAFEGASDADWAKARTDDARLFYAVTKKLFMAHPIVSHLNVDSQFVTHKLKPMRNLFFHAAQTPKLAVHVDLSKPDWETCADELEERVAGMMRALDRVLQTYDLVRKGPVEP